MLKAQYINWASFDSVLSNCPNALYYDSVDGSMYVGGLYYRIDTDTIWGMGKYQNGQWLRMGNGINWDRTVPFCATCWPNPVRDIIKYHDTLYITGDISFSGNTILNGIAWWDGINWQPIIGSSGSNGMYGFGKKFEIYNDELYVMGAFDSIAGVAANSIAKYNGTNWQPVYNLQQIDAFNSDRIYDMEFYNGELYLGGTFANFSNNIYHLIKWDGTNWVSPGFGAYGIADVSKLFTFQGELYVTGQWSEYYNPNNIGHCVAKYNGTSWTAVGTGFFYYPNSLAAVRSYAIKDNELFLGGNFDYCNGTHIYNIVKYDGNTWCSLDTTFNELAQIQEIEFMHDTLFIGGQLELYMGLSYCIDEHYTDNCNIDFTSVENINQTNFSIYPNPATNQITLSISAETINPGIVTYTLSNLLGEKIGAGYITEDNPSIAIEKLPAGMYWVELSIGNKKVCKKLLKI